MTREQEVPVVVEIADDRRGDALGPECGNNRGDRHRCGVVVDRDADEFAAGARKLRHLPDRRIDVGGIGIRHGLHDDRMS